MSSDSGSVYSEKKIAAYESLFKETNFSKPQEVYLTITVAHIFGQAYVMDQEGTQEGEPVYSRFVCSLDEITRVYINDNVKSSPLFIQSDRYVKGVFHRTRIIVPCLENVSAVMAQINEVKEEYMKKFDAAKEREMAQKQKKREELESARMKEREEAFKSSTVIPLEKITESVSETASSLPAPPSFLSSPEGSPAPEDKDIKTPVKPKPLSSAAALSNELAESFKTFNMLDSSTKIKPLPKKPALDLDDIPDAEDIVSSPANTMETPPKLDLEKSIPKPKPVPAAQELIELIEGVPKEQPAKEQQTENTSSVPEKPSVPEPLAQEPPVSPAPPVPPVQPAPSVQPVPPVPELTVPEPEIPDEQLLTEPAEEVRTERKPEPMPAPAPVPDYIHRPAPVAFNAGGKAAELADFEASVLKLKSMKDNGLLSDEEYAVERKRLISTLY